MGIDASPFKPGVGLIVEFSFPVCFADPVPGFFLCQAAALCDSFDPVGLFGADKDVDTVIFVPQYVVGTASDDDTGTPLCETENDLGLFLIHLHIERRHIGRSVDETGVAYGRFAVGSDESVQRGFIRPANTFLGIAQLLCRHGHKLVVVERDPKTFSQFFPDFMSAASELTADGNDFVF